MSHVLIVEDDERIAKAMGMRLNSVGHSIEVAHDAVIATTMARQNPPDLVLMDISLPGGDGFTVCERLRDIPETANVPIVFVTASRQPGLRERARKLGAVAFLEKPFGASELLQVIEECEAQQYSAQA